jgi:hypothetical protein
MTRHRLKIIVQPDVFAICKLAPTESIPAWAASGSLFSITRTADELSIVCQERHVPAGTKCDKGWRCVRVAGAMPFSLVGVLASLVTPLAEAGISVFAVSTFDTDYVLVKDWDMERAVGAWRHAKHTVE